MRGVVQERADVGPREAIGRSNAIESPECIAVGMGNIVSYSVEVPHHDVSLQRKRYLILVLYAKTFYHADDEFVTVPHLTCHPHGLSHTFRNGS